MVVERPAHRAAVQQRRVRAAELTSVDARAETADHGVHHQADDRRVWAGPHADLDRAAVPRDGVGQHRDAWRPEAVIGRRRIERQPRPEMGVVLRDRPSLRMRTQERTRVVVVTVDRLPPRPAVRGQPVRDASEPRMLTVERHRGPDGEEDCRAGHRQRARQPETEGGQDDCQRQHEEAGEQPHGDHRDALLEPRRHEQQVDGRAEQHQTRHGAGESDERRRRSHARGAVDQGGAGEAERGGGQRPREQVAGAGKGDAHDHGGRRPPSQGDHGDVPDAQPAQQERVNEKDDGRGEQHEAETVPVADHHAGPRPRTILVGGPVHGPDESDDRERGDQGTDGGERRPRDAACSEQPAARRQDDDADVQRQGEGEEGPHQRHGIRDRLAADDVEVHDVGPLHPPQVRVAEPARQSQYRLARVLESRLVERVQRVVGGVVVRRSVEHPEAQAGDAVACQRAEVAHHRQTA